MNQQQDERPVVNYNSGDQNIEFTNPSYINNAPDNDTLQEMVQDRMAKEDLVGINLDPASVKKRNDIKVTENVLYLAPDRAGSSGVSTENPLYAVAGGAEGRGPKMVNVDPQKPINVKGKGEGLKPGLDPVYEELGAVKADAKKISADYEDLDLEKEKMKVHMKSAHGRNMSYEEWDPKIQGKGKHNKEKPDKNKRSEDNRPRYEDHPISFKRTPRENHDNVGALVHQNPIYDNAPVPPGRHPEKHLYESLREGPRDDVISGSSIVNPVYGDTIDFEEGAGDSAPEDPVYENIPKKGDAKAKRRSFLRSVSSEKSGGYEELEKSDDEDEEDEEETEKDGDVFKSSKA